MKLTHMSNLYHDPAISEKKLYSLDLNSELAAYLQEHINKHLSIEEVESITISKIMPKNVTVTKESDTYNTIKFENLKP